MLGKQGKEKSSLSILDVGCGKGEIMNALNREGFNPIGVDVNPACAESARTFGSTFVADIMTLDKLFSEKPFDVVICSHVLEHVENPKRAVGILKSISAKYLVIAVPNLFRIANFAIRKPRYVNEGHMHGWDAPHFKTFLELHCGLTIMRWIPDGVFISPLHAIFGLNSRLLDALEYKMLPKVVPQMQNALVVICEK